MTSADSAGQAWHTPSEAISAAGGLPPPAAPPRPPVGPPPAADPYPDVAPAASVQPVIGVHLRVSKRLLWVGDAYYPIQNIARVYTLTIHPRRREAVVLFVKRLLLTGVVTTFLGLLAAAIDAFGSGDSGGLPGSPFSF